MIRVLVAEDSLITSKLITGILESDPDIKVVGVARNGQEAIQMAAKLRPDLITMDIHMPVMDGTEATKQIMAYTPTPILLLTSSTLHEGVGKVFDAISFGALDIINKDLLNDVMVNESVGKSLIDRAKLLVRIRVITHPLAKLQRREAAAGFLAGIQTQAQRKIVGIAASTGGPEALQIVLRALPADFPVPIVVVQHITPGFVAGLAEWLGHYSPLKVKVAENDDVLKQGTVYIAPTELQMQVTQERHIEIHNDPAVDGQRPSGTVLFKSLAEYHGKNSLGVILTGMGRDGARGLKELHDAGGHVIAQSEPSCVVYGMPKSAVELGCVDEVVAVEDIPSRMIKWATD
jgi:two-component system chemotaxis response regulator CheB